MFKYVRAVGDMRLQLPVVGSSGDYYFFLLLFVVGLLILFFRLILFYCHLFPAGGHLFSFVIGLARKLPTDHPVSD